MKRLALITLLTAGCRTEPLPGPEPASVAIANPSCVPEGKRCGQCCSGYCDVVGYGWGYCRAYQQLGMMCTDDRECAPGLFCDNQGYGTWECAAPRPDGAHCWEDNHCVSGLCSGYQCGKPRCEARSCETDQDCCDDCLLDRYGPWWECADGKSTNGDCGSGKRWCRSGMCVDDSCTP